VHTPLLSQTARETDESLVERPPTLNTAQFTSAFTCRQLSVPDRVTANALARFFYVLQASNSSSGPSNAAAGADDPNVIAVSALTAGITSSMSGVRGELLSILSELRWLTNKVFQLLCDVAIDSFVYGSHDQMPGRILHLNSPSIS
jgi:hypothetical protein